MPCESYRGPRRDEIAAHYNQHPPTPQAVVDGPPVRTRDALDHATRLLCELCKVLKGYGMLHTYASPELLAWYAQHLTEDTYRLREKRAAILRKLTAEDRALLGFE